MNSFLPNLRSNSRSARDSYIQISNFLHGQRPPRLRCQHNDPGISASLPLHKSGQSRPFYSSHKLKLQDGKDITSGFPTPAETDARQEQPVNETNHHPQERQSNQTSDRATKIHSSPDSGGAAHWTAESVASSAVHKTLRRYEQQLHQSHAERDTSRFSGWETAMHVSRGPRSQPAREIEINGFITSERFNKSAGVSFVQLVDPNLRIGIQLVISQEKKTENTGRFSPLNVIPHTPVKVKGELVFRPLQNKEDGKNVVRKMETATKSIDPPQEVWLPRRLDPYVGHIQLLALMEMHVKAVDIVPLNSFPQALIAKADTNFPLEQRHLQMRTSSDLRNNIRKRSLMTARTRQYLFRQGFDEVETPLLFKSTPEGAREFLVPTRKAGMAYALPQSPQQYKQLLMASGVSRYFQFAKCFRDEDMRADRQPEFTQLDLEMSFATRIDVMDVIEHLVSKVLWVGIETPEAKPLMRPDPKMLKSTRTFPVMSYHEAMTMYGSDKPDLRFESKFQRVEDIIPPGLKSMLTPLENPVVEIFKFSMDGLNPKASSKFIGEFLDAPNSAEYLNNPAGQPGVGVYDPTKPLNGLASFGHEAAAAIEETFKPEAGDLFLIQARPNLQFTGGSTPLGNLRRDIYLAALSQQLIKPRKEPSFLWVVDFPLFSPVVDAEPGQGGGAGICSTHHPFTAPKAGQDLTKLYTDPLSVIGDHYDLVINGVEVGGGSQRIHDSQVQEMIFRDVLKMKPERVEDFRHLLNALAAGCPPHAGFALGFDRLMALLLGRDSLRDVIAFPKSATGEDKMVSSPAKISREQLDTYHLAVKPGSQPQEPPLISLKA